jgi:hypothetical protein
MPKIVLAVFVLLLLNRATAQDLSGTWNGTGIYPPGEAMTTVMTKMGAEKKLILQIDPAGIVKGTLQALFNKQKATLSTENINQDFTISGRYNASGKSLLLIVTHIKDPANAQARGVPFSKPDSLYYDMDLQMEKNNWILKGSINKKLNQYVSGEWIGSSNGEGLGMNISDKLNMHLLPLRIQLERIAQPLANIPENPKPDTLPARKLDIQRTIILDTSFITISLYDNGIIDGDIATVLLDGKPILEKILLSTVAATVSLNLSKEPSGHILELFANNLGSIPPNTALLVLICNKKRYEITLSSDEMVNGGVRLLFKKQS